MQALFFQFYDTFTLSMNVLPGEYFQPELYIQGRDQKLSR